MRFAVIILAIIALTASAWDFVDTEGDWLSAKWLPGGEILLTEANYRGLFIHREGEKLDTLTLAWKAGYRPAVDESGLVAYTAYEDIDGPGHVRVYDLLDDRAWEIHSGQKIGPASFSPGAGVVFSNSEEIFIYAPDGSSFQSFPGGAHVVLPVGGGGFFFCDRSGIAYHYEPLTGKPRPIDLPGTGRFTFSPVKSSYSGWVAFEDIGGAVFLFNPYTRDILELPEGDRPIFIEKPEVARNLGREPFGVLQLQLEDDGENITSSKIIYIGIEEAKIAFVKEVLEDVCEFIITDIDYSPWHGLLMTTRDGRLIVEKDCAEVFSR
ncbi:MAG: hypothetical protein ACP5G4_00415 [bacterium]